MADTILLFPYMPWEREMLRPLQKLMLGTDTITVATMDTPIHTVMDFVTHTGVKLPTYLPILFLRDF